MMLSLFALVAVRLMPSLNRISAAGASIRYNSHYLNDLYDNLLSCEQMAGPPQSEERIVPIHFEKGIELRGVTFFYEGAQKPAVDHVSFFIPKNQSIGFVGTSGAGKSTAIDIILGLLDPTEGSVLVDGRDIHEYIRSWQRQIGYIPQAIYLADDTIKSNVAFGLKTEEIREENVWQALRLAQLEDFVRSLPDQLETMIGERGIRLSGGQRQRIGIARALYNNPEILVMDEATSALDNETEQGFMEALSGLAGDKTILIIAHRLTTVQHCDKILFLKDGRLLGEGNYRALLETCPEFCRMAGGGHFKS
jgi:ATP-binding cassette subfamily C protein